MAKFPRDGVPDELRKRLRRLALLVRLLIVIGALLTVGCTAWVWIVPGHAHSQIKEAADVDIDQMALQRLWRLFGEYAQARVFSQRALLDLRGFARCVLTLAFVSPIYGALLSVI